MEVGQEQLITMIRTLGNLTNFSDMKVETCKLIFGLCQNNPLLLDMTLYNAVCSYLEETKDIRV